MAARPAQILDCPGGSLKPGEPADVVIFDPQAEWEVNPAELVSKSKNSPFAGRKLKGKVESVWVNGNLRYHEGDFIE